MTRKNLAYPGLDDGFPPGLCVDCGMSVPGGDIICDFCKGAWQVFSYSGHLRQRGQTTVQPGAEEFSGQGRMQLLPPEEADGV